MTRRTTIAAAVLALAVPAALTGCGDDEDPRAVTCATLRGDLRLGTDGTGTCEVPRTAYAVETVRLDADGALDAADAARRRAACEADARRAVERARAAAGRRTAGTFASARWEDPGVCRARSERLPAAEARALRAERLVDEGRTALRAGNTETALYLARQADALASSVGSRGLVTRARAAAAGGPPGGPSTSVVSPNEYLGLPCSQIGHAFRVAPGSDPAHDPDGDGEACEGE